MMSNKRRMITTIAILLFAATFGAASTTIAADKEGAHGEHQQGHDDGKHHMPHGKCNMMSKADSDKDGKISKEEFLKYHETKFEKKDLNNDGVIDEEEMQKMMHKHMHGSGHGHRGSGKMEMGEKSHSHGDDSQE